MLRTWLTRSRLITQRRVKNKRHVHGREDKGRATDHLRMMPSMASPNPFACFCPGFHLYPGTGVGYDFIQFP